MNLRQRLSDALAVDTLLIATSLSGYDDGTTQPVAHPLGDGVVGIQAVVLPVVRERR
jgi:hypothetical protein